MCPFKKRQRLNPIKGLVFTYIQLKDMKTIALFGGTGRTGQHIVRQALEKGYTIKALARNPEKLDVQHPKLEIIQGDVHDAVIVEKVVAGSDVVITAVGYTKTSAKDVQTTATRHITAAMKKHGVTRIVSLSGAGLDSPKDTDHFGRKVVKFIMNLVAKDILKDAENHYEILKNSGTEWTIARPPRLSDGSHTGKYKTGYLKLGPGDKLSRANLADFMLTQVEETRYIGEMPNVTNA